MVWLQPGWLVLLLALPVLAYLPRGERDTRQVALRAAVLGLLVLALARPVRLVGEAEPVHVLVVDVSASCAERVPLEDLVELARREGEAGEVHLVSVGGELPLAEAQRAVLDAVHTLADVTSSSPLALGLERAATLVPDGTAGSLTLVSDGLATDTRWARAAQALEERGLPVHVVPLAVNGGDVHPVSLEPLQRLRVGATARVQVTLVGEATACDLVLSGPDGCDGRVSVVLEFEPEAAGFLEVELQLAVVDGANRLDTNDTLRTTLAVDDPLRVLYLGERVAGGGEQLGTLVGQGFEITPWQGETLGPERLGGFDLAVVDDLTAESLGEPAQDALVGAVRDRGLGLVASGGTAAFGPGGYHEAPLEELLPVEFVQK